MGFKFLPEVFNFAAPAWLWGLAVLPVIWALYMLFYRRRRGGAAQLAAFADPHLLPHLLDRHGQDGAKKIRALRSLPGWSVIWICGMLAMAGPRWDYTEVEAFTPARNLVVLLDLSRSMDAEDLKPSRLVRARQEIQDLLASAQGTNIALVAFASVPHLITPLTDDVQTTLRLLPSLDTSIVYAQGSALVPALRMAGKMLGEEKGSQDHIVVFSDGGFEDGDAAILEEELKLKAQGTEIDVVGMGTPEGAPVPGEHGQMRKNGQIVLTRLEDKRLQRIARDGGGIYLQSDYLAGDTQALLTRIGHPADAGEQAKQKTKFWEERFYLCLIPFVLLALPWFRRNAAFPALIVALILLQPAAAQAEGLRSLFLNKEQQGSAAIAQGQYKRAEEVFSDPYRRGVAQYKAGDYKAAAESFARAERPEIREQAKYNLGNAQLMGGKVDEAIRTYEDVLKIDPRNDDAKHNLEIAKKLKQQQQKQQQNQQQKSGDQKQNQPGDQGNKGGQGQQPQDKGGNKDKDQKGENKDKQGQAQDRKGEDAQQKDAQAGQQDGEGQSDKNNPQQKQEEQNELQQGQKDKQDKDNRQGAERMARAAQDAQKGEPPPTGQAARARRSQKDIDADQWLNRIQNDPQTFLRNKFYIESQRSGAKQGGSPW